MERTNLKDSLCLLTKHKVLELKGEELFFTKRFISHIISLNGTHTAEDITSEAAKIIISSEETISETDLENIITITDTLLQMHDIIDYPDLSEYLA